MSLEQRVRSTLKDAGSRIDIATEPTTVRVASEGRPRPSRPMLAFATGFAAVLLFGVVGILVSGDGAGGPGETTNDAQPTFSGLLGSIVGLLPDGFDPDQAAPLFTLEGGPEEVAAQYLDARIPTIGAGITRVEEQDGYTLVEWAWGRRLNPYDLQSERGERGWLVLRPRSGGYAVVAATTDGVDLSDLSRTGGAVTGVISASTGDFIGVDLLDLDGSPIETAPYPDGFVPEADSLWGTAGAGSPPLTLDVPATGPVIVRIHRVGGTFLSISEVILGPTPEAPANDVTGVWQLQRFTIGGERQDVAIGVNAAREPWVRLDGEAMSGEAGCNSFEGSYVYEDRVFTADLYMNAARCSEPDNVNLMEVELAFQEVVTSNESVTVTFEGDRMIWSNGDTTLEFVSVESPPTNQPADVLDLSEAAWVTHGPDGLRLDDGTLIWETQPFPADVARDRQGGLVFSDSTGLWWFPTGTVEPSLVLEGDHGLVTVVTTPNGPMAMTTGDPSFYRLSDGEAAEAPAELPVEISAETPWLWKLTASNGITAWVSEPEVEMNQENQPSEILEPAHLIVSQDGEVLVDVRVGDLEEAWVRMHDFDGRRLLLSRGPFEPAMPEETFLLVDLATGEVTEAFVAGGARATFTGPDTDWNGPVQSPDFSG